MISNSNPENLLDAEIVSRNADFFIGDKSKKNTEESRVYARSRGQFFRGAQIRRAS